MIPLTVVQILLPRVVHGCMGGGKSMETGCDCVPQNWGA